MMRFYAPFIKEATPQVAMALRSERAMVRQKIQGGALGLSRNHSGTLWKGPEVPPLVIWTSKRKSCSSGC